MATKGMLDLAFEGAGVVIPKPKEDGSFTNKMHIIWYGELLRQEYDFDKTGLDQAINGLNFGFYLLSDEV